MTKPISNLTELLRTMQPLRNPGVYVYASIPLDTDTTTLRPLATFREQEGLTVVVEEAAAQRANLVVLFRCTWITLMVHSDLEAVGLTAAFAAVLGEANISCNVVAGSYHDHIFVPVELGDAAMKALKGLQQRNL
jgi:uncharacterized protein